MQDQQRRKEDLLKELRAEIARLLLADDVSEAEKLFRIKRAQEILEAEEISG